MFQDEARFGRLSSPQRCWAPKPVRPLVTQGVVREYIYAYAALSPEDGRLDWVMVPSMRTVAAGDFLQKVAGNHPREFVVMVWDGAPSHRSGELHVPDNMALVRLPPYSPELNPVEHLWDEIREKHFANRVFDSLDAVSAQASAALATWADSPGAVRSLAGWPWILASIQSS
jgi:hypothetical protein